MTGSAALSTRLVGPGLVLLVLAGVISSLFAAEQPLVQTRTSHGGTPTAWGAAYELLDTLNLKPTRSRLPLSARSPRQTQWLVEPEWDRADIDYAANEIERFARAGGTVLVIGAPTRLWEALSVARAEPPQAADDAADATAKPDRDSEPEPATVTRTIRGVWLGVPRKLVLASDELLFDAEASEGSTLRAGTAQGAFVLERALGKGRVVAVADSTFLSNAQLDQHGDAAFVLDLVRAYGAPSFDEHCHGLSVSRSPWSALGTGFVVLTLAALLALTLAALGYARRWPLPERAEARVPAPTLEVFAGSLANLYRSWGARDPAAVFRAYRAGYLRRLQRALVGDREITQAQLEAQLARDASRLGPDGKWLDPAAAPRTAAELRRAVVALERQGALLAHRKAG
jgi:hypothetical protein